MAHTHAEIPELPAFLWVLEPSGQGVHDTEAEVDNVFSGQTSHAAPENLETVPAGQGGQYEKPLPASYAALAVKGSNLSL
jgi:hypothetical protein